MGSFGFESEVIASISETVSYLSLAANAALGGLGAYLFKKRHKEHYNATHDTLTGLLNVRGLEEVLEKNAPPQALLYVDATNLKSVNDRLGHAAGNRALRGTTAIINTILRESDIAARVGGDEFLVLLNQDRRLDRKDGETLMRPHELLSIVVSRVNEGTGLFLNENPDLRGAGLNIAVGGVVSQPGMTIDQLTDAAEEKMTAHKALQHEAVGQYRPLAPIP